MDNERNQHQIIRKDARNCFVESLSDAFAFGKVHLGFATYDTKLPAGQRQTNSVHIYIAVDEFLELCRKLSSGEMRQRVAQMKKSEEKAPLYKCLGGTSAEKLTKIDRARPDGMSLSRTAELHCGKNADFLFVANSGPGETNKTGLIVPRFGNKPENHVAVSMTWDTFSGFMLTTIMKLGWRRGTQSRMGLESRKPSRSGRPRLRLRSRNIRQSRSMRLCRCFNSNVEK